MHKSHKAKKGAEGRGRACEEYVHTGVSRLSTFLFHWSRQDTKEKENSVSEVGKRQHGGPVCIIPILTVSFKAGHLQTLTASSLRLADGMQSDAGLIDFPASGLV